MKAYMRQILNYALDVRVGLHSTQERTIDKLCISPQQQMLPMSQISSLIHHFILLLYPMTIITPLLMSCLKGNCGG